MRSPPVGRASGAGSSATTSPAAPVASTATRATCPHPASDGTAATEVGAPGDDYVTAKNPWVYFRSVIGTTSTCDHVDVGLDQLSTDLGSLGTTPAFSYIAADPCDDGTATPCRKGAPAGAASAVARPELQPDRDRALGVRQRRDESLEKLKATVTRLQDMGALVKDLDKGLVDFPTLFRGEQVYLCWKMDEDKIGFWHGDEGFSGRKPIDQDFLDNHRGDPVS